MTDLRSPYPWFGGKIGAYCLWGKFPDFEATTSKRKESLPSWKKQERALVPYSISLALALACEAKWNGIIEVAV